MRKLIQDSTFLGINRVPEDDVYYILQNKVIPPNKR
jgi:hypothetical protein